MNRSALTATFGAVIEPGTDDGLDHLSASAVMDMCIADGVVVLRGFRTDIEAFGDFTSRFLVKSIVNGNDTRQDVVRDRDIQTVNSGDAPIALHAEMAYSPMRPDVLFFYCIEAPPSGGGETLLCDGVALWESMRASTRALFEGQPVRYRYVRNSLLGAQFKGHEGRVVGDTRVRSFRRHDDGAVDLDFVVSAIVPTRAGASAFANSVIVEAASVTFEDGAGIDESARYELYATSTRLAHRFAWQHGDIAMVDNLRVMHGRARIRPDVRRNIALRMGWFQ